MLRMPTKLKPRRPKTARERKQARRDRLRWQGRLLAQHPENDEIDAWIEQMYDSSDWK